MASTGNQEDSEGGKVLVNPDAFDSSMEGGGLVDGTKPLDDPAELLISAERLAMFEKELEDSAASQGLVFVKPNSAVLMNLMIGLRGPHCNCFAVCWLLLIDRVNPPDEYKAAYKTYIEMERGALEARREERLARWMEEDMTVSKMEKIKMFTKDLEEAPVRVPANPDARKWGLASRRVVLSDEENAIIQMFADDTLRDFEEARRSIVDVGSNVEAGSIRI
ncbi:hypothetical protein LINGRAHAP2_LOCUS34092 [Linum grandiflorum]